MAELPNHFPWDFETQTSTTNQAPASTPPPPAWQTHASPRKQQFDPSEQRPVQTAPSPRPVPNPRQIQAWRAQDPSMHRYRLLDGEMQYYNAMRGIGGPARVQQMATSPVSQHRQVGIQRNETREPRIQHPTGVSGAPYQGPHRARTIPPPPTHPYPPAVANINNLTSQTPFRPTRTQNGTSAAITNTHPNLQNHPALMHQYDALSDVVTPPESPFPRLHFMHLTSTDSYIYLRSAIPISGPDERFEIDPVPGQDWCVISRTRDIESFVTRKARLQYDENGFPIRVDRREEEERARWDERDWVWMVFMPRQWKVIKVKANLDGVWITVHMGSAVIQ